MTASIIQSLNGIPIRLTSERWVHITEEHCELAAISQFDLLRIYFFFVLIPNAVHEEVVRAGDEQHGALETRAGVEEGWIAVVDPTSDPRIAFLLDQGMTPTDAHVVVLAQKRQADLLIADDAMVREQTQSLGLPLSGTLGILLNAQRDGHLPDLKGMLDQRIAAGFYLQPNGPFYKDLLRHAV